jgi:Ribonuclease G/E
MDIRRYLIRKLTMKRKKWGFWWKEKTTLWRNIYESYGFELKSIMINEQKAVFEADLFRRDVIDFAYNFKEGDKKKQFNWIKISKEGIEKLKLRENDLMKRIHQKEKGFT